jgi:hypothetical protein
MRTVRTKVYQFSELSEQAKEKAIEQFSDINVDFEWWDGIYMDAENIGLNITSFDLDRNRHAKGEFIVSGYDCAEKILDTHGKDCETYKTAHSFLQEYKTAESLFLADEENDGFYFEHEEESGELEEEFLRSILEDYSIMLQNDFEYQQSDEAIIETIEANHYEFTKDGNRF